MGMMSSIVSLNPRSCEEIAPLSLFLYLETRTLKLHVEAIVEALG